MKLTDKQFEALAKYEDNFRTAINSRWSRGISAAAYDFMREVYQSATGQTMPGRPSCGNCILRMLQAVGRLYFADKAEREQAAENAEKAKSAASSKKTVKSTTGGKRVANKAVSAKK